jgi:hypothetical protein
VRFAVFTEINGSTCDTICVSSSLIDATGLISDFVSMHEVEGAVSFSTIAPVVIVRARDDNLRRYVDVWPCSLSCNLYSVREGGGCSLSPAGAAVLWNVLVLDIGKVVDSVDIVPDVLLG